MSNSATTQLDFSVSNQSMWTSGTSLGTIGLNFNDLVWHANGQKGDSIQFALADLSYSISYGIEVGPTLQLDLNGGSVAIDYPIQVNVTAPSSVQSGTDFVLDTSNWSVSNPSLTAASPTIDAGVGMLFNVDGSLSLVLDPNIPLVDSVSLDVPSFSAKLGPQIDLGEHSTELGNYLEIDWNLSQPSNGQSNAIGVVEHALPAIGAIAQQADDFVSLTADLDAVARRAGETFVPAARALPALDCYYYFDDGLNQLVAYDPVTLIAHPTPNQTVDLDVDHDGAVDNGYLALGYTFFDFDAVVGARLTQNLTFVPTEVDVTMSSSAGETMSGNLGQQFTFTAPSATSGDLTIATTYTLNGYLHNQTGLIVHGSLRTRALGLDTSFEPYFGDLFEGALIDASINASSDPYYLLDRKIPITLTAPASSYTVHYSTAATTEAVGGETNQAPTNIALSNSVVSENQLGATIGRLTASDADSADIHTYSVNDARFLVAPGGYLKLAPDVSADYETEPLIPLTITATDSGGLSVSREIAVAVQDVQESSTGHHGPTRILLNNTSVRECLPGARVGFLRAVDQDVGDSHTFAVSDTRFEVGTVKDLRLKAGYSLDFESEPTINITVTGTDRSGSSLDQAFVLTVVDEPESGSGSGNISASSLSADPLFMINLTADRVREDTLGDWIGVVRINDAPLDNGYSLSVDDARFEIGSAGWLRLRDNVSLDYEQAHSVPIYITATSSEGRSATWHFVLQVQDFLDQEYLEGSAGDDTLIVQPETDFVCGYGGDDVIQVGAGNSNVDGGAGIDLAMINASNSNGMAPLRLTVTNSSGDSYVFQDAVRYDEGLLWFAHGMGDISRIQVQKGNAGNSTFAGMEQVDILGTDRDDFIPFLNGTQYHGGEGMDTFYANWSTFDNGIAWINTGAPATPCTGITVSGMERLLLTTGSGNDSIDNSGFATDDYWDTGTGDDVLKPGAGHNVLFGGVGADTYRISTRAGYAYDQIFDDGGTVVLENVNNLGAMTLGRSGRALEMRLTGADDFVVIENYFANDSTTTDYANAWTFEFGERTYSSDDIVHALTTDTGIDSISLIPSVLRAGNVATVYEGVRGGQIGQVTVWDADLLDTHTLSVDDSRFVLTPLYVNGNSSFYNLSLAADQALDFETTSSVSLTLIATDSSGASLGRVFRIDVLDVEEQEPIWALHPLGNEFLVNSYTGGDQYSPTLAALAGGGFIAIWTSVGQDGGGEGIYGQRYDTSGAATGSAFRINTYSTGNQSNADVAGLADGGFVATWTSVGQGGNSYGVYGQRYDAIGNPVGAEFQVSFTNSSAQYSSSVAALSGGGFVIAGRDAGSGNVYAKTFAADGTSVGSTVQAGASAGVHASVVGLADGGSVVLRSSSGEVVAQVLSANGAVVGPEFTVNTYTQSSQDYPDAALLSDGDFVIVWRSEGQDGDQGGIYGQRFAADGTQRGVEFRVNPVTDNEQGQSGELSVAALPSGGFAVTWASYGGLDGSDTGVFVRIYDSSGQAVAYSQLNTYTAGSQGDPSIAALSDGTLVAAWSSAQQDGDGGGIYAQRLSIDMTEPNVAPAAVALDSYDVTEMLKGAVVGALTTTDSNAGDVHAYAVDDNRFEIVEAQLRLKSTQVLSNSIADTVSVTVTATDAAGLSIQQPFYIHVIPTAVVGTSVIYRSDADAYRGSGTAGSVPDTFYADWSAATAAIVWDNAPAEIAIIDGVIVPKAQVVNGVSVSSLECLQLQTGAGNDVLSNGAVSTDDAFVTGAGDDQVAGGGGSDVISAGDGNDTLDGGTGSDTLIGGTGNDVFALAVSGNDIDTITDFTAGDVFRVAGAAFSGPTTAGDGTTLVLNEVQLATSGDITTLTIGMDATAGTDVTVRLNGAFAPNQLYAFGTEIGFNHTPTGSVMVTGTMTPGQTLTASNSLVDTDGLGTIAYQWECSADGITWNTIGGATGNTFVLTGTQPGEQIRAIAGYIDGHGVAEYVQSSAISAGKAAALLAYTWKSHTLLDGVTVTVGNTTHSTTSEGSTIFDAITEPNLSLVATRGTPSAEASLTSQAVNLQDAIAILKMIVGLDVNGANKPLSPYQSIAADYDGSGMVDLTDAINVLKHVVGLTAPDPQWRFVNEADASIPSMGHLNPGTVRATVSADMSETTSAIHVGIVGILSGDVDGSFAGEQGSTNLDVSQSTYFIDLATTHALPLSQFGVYG